MSLGDEWDAVGAAPASVAAKGSVADDWDATPAAKPAESKPIGSPQPLTWFERQLAKLPDSWAKSRDTIRADVGTALGASPAGGAVMGALDMGTGAVQGAARLTGSGPEVDKRIAQTGEAYEAARQANAPRNLSGLVTGAKPDAGTDWPRIGGDVATGLALPVGKLAEGANFVNRLIHAEKVAIPISLSQPVSDTANYWTEKLKQGAAGVLGTAVGMPVAEMGAKVAGTVANKAMDLWRRFRPDPADGTVAAIRTTSPELQDAVTKAQQSGAKIDPEVLGRQIEADSLPVKMSLTEGQAQQDPIKISNEMNLRGRNPAIVYKLRDQNQALVDNLNAIRSNVAPEATAPDHVIAGQHLIDSITTADAAKQAQITGLYQKLRDANGGKWPVDGQSFVAKADEALGAEMKRPFLPAQVRELMDGFRDGTKQMTFENFENMRTILAAEGRKAERAGDGNTSAAINVVRNSLEQLPITGLTGVVKSLADTARTAARERFDQIKETPALKAVVNDNIAADDFIRKHVIGAKKQDLMNLAMTLKDDPVALQTMKAGVVNYLKSAAGIVNDNGNFSQAGYNKALEALKPKLSVLFNEDEGKVLQSVGNVARYTQLQPRGSFVNNSNTDVAAVARGAAAHAADAATGTGIPSLVNRGVTSMLEKKANTTRLGDILNPGAGVSSPGAAQKLLTQTFPVTAGQYATIPLGSMASQYVSKRSDQRPDNRQ